MTGSTPHASLEPLRRWVAFSLVGGLGVGVQTAALVLLTRIAGWSYLPATALAVEMAVLHNFVWHERWTWAARASQGASQRLSRLARFHAANGLISIVGTVGCMVVYVSILGLPPVPGNLLAIGTTSLANFLVADRWVFRTVPMRVAALLLIGNLTVAGRPAMATDLKTETVSAWDRYVEVTEERIRRDERARTHIATPSSGTGLVKLDSPNRSDLEPVGTTIEVPGGLIHHWRGSVLIARVTLDELLWALENPAAGYQGQEDVLESRVLERRDDWFRLYLKLTRRQIVTATYNTEHDVRFLRHSSRLATSRSVATKIAELENAGTPVERERPVGHDRGFLWRLNSYWRYEEVAGGVLVSLESLSLSRDVPSILKPIAMPVINRIARESMTRTLMSLRQRFGGPQVASAPVRAPAPPKGEWVG